MVRVITQQTFDDVVKENIEDLEMSPEDALQEAIEQFQAQGVNLSNIIKELSLDSNKEHLVSATVKKLNKLVKESTSDEEIIENLRVLKAECDKDLAHRMMASKDGAYNVLIELIERHQPKYIENKTEESKVMILEVLKTLNSLMDTQPDLLEDRGVTVMKITLDKVSDEAILIQTLQWMSKCCLKHEMNRRALFKAKIPDNLAMLLKSVNDKKLLSEVLLLIRRLTFDDDVRVEFGKAHEHARELAAANLDTLQTLLKDHQTPPLVGELMSTVASLLVRDELCAAMSHSVETLLAVLSQCGDTAVLTQHACALITALSGNDDVKRKFMNSGVAPILISLMNRHVNNAAASAANLKCVSVLCLREVTHSKQFLECGGPEAVVACMNVHTNVSAVQKNGCWAIRNMVSRCRDYNSKFHQLGVEDILNSAFKKFGKDFGFDIKSALRDLDCDVKLDEQWTGRGVQMARD